MATTKELIQKQINEIVNLRTLSSAKNPLFEKWQQLTKAILERRLGKKKSDDFPSFSEFWPNHMGPWYEEELKESLLEGLASAEAYLLGLIDEIDLLGEEKSSPMETKGGPTKNQSFRDITVSGGTLILGDGNKITQVAVRELVKALEEEIEEKVVNSEEKTDVLTSLKKITTNETFASVSGVFLGEVLKRIFKP